MIGMIFGTRRSREIPREDVDRLFQLTDGNPYFLVESLRLMVAANAVVPDREARRWIWKGMDEVALPGTIVTAARAKIERLPPDVRALVEQAAVIGDEFRVPTLCRLSALSEEDVEGLLSHAVRRWPCSTARCSKSH